MESSFDQISNRIKECQRCVLYQGIREYVPGILGSKHPGIVVIGEAPGAMEDITGEPFKGNSGRILNEMMRDTISLYRGEYSILNSLKCRPPENRDPTDREKRLCRPWLLEQLRLIKPHLIITMGVHSSHTILGERYTMEELRNHYYVVDNFTAANGFDCHVFPTFHPMATAYVKARKAAFEADLLSLIGRRYEGVRIRGRCTLPLNAPQSLDGSG